MDNHLYIVFLSLGVLLATARLLGEVTKQLGLTALLGEILAGVLLGPTFLGRIAPEIGTKLFPTSGAGAVFWESMTGIAVVLFLLVSGMEVNLSARFGTRSPHHRQNRLPALRFDIRYFAQGECGEARVPLVGRLMMALR